MNPSQGLRPAVVTLDRIIETARATAVGDDPVPEAFTGNLKALVDALNEEGHLSRFGATAVGWMLADALRKRIDVSWWWANEPGIRAGVIERPIFLTGLPRSGTTYFQYLFDREPAMRMLRTWEGEAPCPPSAADPASAELRRARTREAHRQRRQEDGGAMDAFHLSDPDGPQECVKLVDQTFANAGNYWTFRVPAYFDSLTAAFDLSASYEHHKRVLQVLQWQAPPARVGAEMALPPACPRADPPSLPRRPVRRDPPGPGPGTRLQLQLLHLPAPQVF